MNDNREIEDACTTIIVGSEQTPDGSMILARSEDLTFRKSVNLEYFDSKSGVSEEFVARDGGFSCSLPCSRLAYSAMPGYGESGEWGSAGFNSAGVGMSSTETILANDKVLHLDPLVETGIDENSVYNIVLPYVHTSREGIERLAELIERYGCRSGMGIGLIDLNEIWYMETSGGHRYLAQKIPNDYYFVSANQGRLRDYITNNPDYIASSDLIQFAEQNGLWNPNIETFDFHNVYQREDATDVTNNYPRIYQLQKMFSPSIQNDISRNTFPVFAKPLKPISISDIRNAFRNHYDETFHDPYTNSNPLESYRPISVFRTTQTHILHVRPWLPKEIGEVVYLSLGMADLSVFVPIYQGFHEYPIEYKIGGERSCRDSAYWKMRHVQILGMMDYNRCAPIIKERFKFLEEEFDNKQIAFEKEYIALSKKNKNEAHVLLNKFNREIMLKALSVTDELLETLYTMLCCYIEKEYHF